MFRKNVCGLLVILASCSSPNAGSGEPTADAIVDSLGKTSVLTAIAVNAPFYYLITSNGKVLSHRDQLFIAEQTGHIINANLANAQRVSAGTQLLQLETQPIETKLARAQQRLYNNQKELESQLLGYRDLLQGKSEAEVAAIKQKLKTSTGVSDAEMDIKEAIYDLNKAHIKAPFSGILANVRVVTGQYITAGSELFRLYDPNDLELEVKVLESDALLLKKGSPAEVRPVSAENIHYTATVSEIDPYVDGNGQVSIKMKLQNGSKNKQMTTLLPGMNCIATIKAMVNNTVIIPKEGLLMRDNRPVVFTFENNKAKWHYVEIGKDNGKEIEIKKGITPGQKVIISNNLQLANDAPVTEANTADNHPQT